MDINELFRAVEAVSRKVLDDEKIDKTIISSISKGPEPDGSYMATYFMEEIKCFPQGLVKYSVGDMVRVLIPEGNFSNKKTILGLTSERTEDIVAEIGDVIVGDGYNYIMDPISWKLSSTSKVIELDSKIVGRVNQKDITHVRIESNIFSNFNVFEGVNFGIELTLVGKSGQSMKMSLDRKLLQGNLGALNGKTQTAIFELGEDLEIVSASARYFSSSDLEMLSFTESKIDLINSYISNTIISGQYKVSITQDQNNITANVKNDEFGELDPKGDIFTYEWFGAIYLEDGTKQLDILESTNKKTIQMRPEYKYYEVAINISE